MAKEKSTVVSDILSLLFWGFGVLAFVRVVVFHKPNPFWGIVLLFYVWGMPLYYAFRAANQPNAGHSRFDIPRGPGDYGQFDGDDGDGF